MKKRSILIVIFILTLQHICYSQIASFNFNTAPFLAPSYEVLHLSVSNIALSSGTISTNSTTGDYFTDEPYIEESGGWMQTNVLDAKYFLIEITAEAGYQFSLSTIFFNTYATASGPSAISIVINDASIITENMPEAELLTINESLSGISQVTYATIKIMGWDNGSRITTGSGVLRLDDLLIDGIVEEIPPNDSSSFIAQTSFLIPNEISSLKNAPSLLPVFELVMGDSASGDGVSTFVDSIIINQSVSNQIDDWTLALNEVKLTSTAFSDTILGNVSPNSVLFITPEFEVKEGVLNADTCKLLINLNNSLSESDNKKLGFLIDSLHVFCNSSGSQVGFGNVSTPTNKLSIQVEATKILAALQPKVLWKDSLFTITVKATDFNGNIDSDENGIIALEQRSGEGELFKKSELTERFFNGVAEFYELAFSGADTLALELKTANYTSFFFNNLMVSKPFFYDDFETNKLDNWNNIKDWAIDADFSIADDFSLKHNLSDVEGTSYIVSDYKKAQMNDGKMVWNLDLFNRSFDPTASNRFWYYLMAAENNLLGKTNYGYVVGVNFSGSSDSLSLWRLNASGSKTELIVSDFDWNENDTVCIEIIREPLGNWQLGYSKVQSLFNYSYSELVNDNTFVDLPYHGLVFQYSSTRAGNLWADDIFAGQINTPPVINTIEGIAEDTLKLEFSEALDPSTVSTLENYHLSSLADTEILIELVSYTKDNPTQVLLIVNRLKTAKYSLVISNLSDVDGSVINPTKEEFDYAVLAPKNDVVFSEIMFDSYPTVGLPEADYLEIYNRGENPFNLQGWQLVINGAVKTFPDSLIEVGESVIITNSASLSDFSTYGKVLGLISSTSLTNSGKSLCLVSNTGQPIDSLFYNPLWIREEGKQDGGWSIEKIDVDNTCSESLNWTASINEYGGTPGTVNSVACTNIDNLAPKLKSWKIASINSFYFEFNEEVGNSATFIFSPSLNGADSLIISENKMGITYYASESVQNNQEYLVNITMLSDLCGNSIDDTLIAFVYHKPEVSDIVFNEIMADPTPSVELPEAKYIELFNRSEYDINLNGWKLTYLTYSRIFPDVIMESGAYLLLCAEADVNQLSEYGDALGILSSTTLTASGRLLAMHDDTDKIICAVNYNKSWYQNLEKEEGGWSLECIDPENTCSQLQNWKASESNDGGTPGKINSVYAANLDLLAPEIAYVKVESNTELAIDFSETIDWVSALSEVNYELETLDIDSINLTGENFTKVEVYFKTPLKNGEDYTLKIKHITDLCGNTIEDTVVHFVFNFIDPNDIVFSEIMIDPAPTVNLPEYEFVELYNRSSKTIDIENWTFVVNGKCKLLPRYTLLPNSFLVIVANNAESEFSFISNRLTLTSFPSLPNQSGTLQLFDNLNQLVNEVQYKDSWYHDEEKDNGGFSLEIIDPENLCGEIYNWAASININGGTPGEINSIDGDNIDELAPFIIQTIPLEASRILLQFSEAIEEYSAVISNFNLEDMGTIEGVILDTITETTVVLELRRNLEINKKYTLDISGIDDYCGNKIKDTIVNLVYHPVQLYEIVINEVMANPEPSAGLPVVEYIELMNCSEFEIIGFSWTLFVGNSRVNLPYLNIPAHGYFVLYDSDYLPLFNQIDNSFAINNLPALPLSGVLKIFDLDAKLICQTEYTNSWFNDDFKADGGYSLERIDFKNPDESSKNWQSSNNELGGTPGKINSVYRENPDFIPPVLLRAFPLADSAIGLKFSEPIYFPAINLGMVKIRNESNLIHSLQIQDDDLSYLCLNLNSMLNIGVEYTIQVSDSITDIAGNFILNTDAILALPSKALANDIVINEILWNPFDGGVDYVELYNKSGFPVNLKQFFVASFSHDGTIKTPNAMTDEGALLFPSHYMVLSENSEIVKQQYWVENPYAFIEVNSLPSFSNTEGSVVIMDTSGVLIDYFYYSDDMHFGLLSSTKGVSLERVHFNRSALEEANWHSASEKSGWGTPGYKNSMFNPEIESEGMLNIEPKVFSPDNDGFEDVLYINYMFNVPGYVANVTAFDRKGRLVKKITENELLGVEGNLSWDGLNENMQKVPIGIYILHFEIFDLEGNIKKYRRVCAVNTRFD